MPRPPCVRRSERFTCVNMSNTVDRCSGRDADPVVANRHHGFAVFGADIDPDVTAGIGVFRSVVDQIREYLREPDRIAVQRRVGIAGPVTSELVPAASTTGRLVSIAAFRTRAQVERLRATSITPRVIRETSRRSSPGARGRLHLTLHHSTVAGRDRSCGPAVLLQQMQAAVSSGDSGFLNSWPERRDELVFRDGPRRGASRPPWHAPRGGRESDTGVRAPEARFGIALTSVATRSGRSSSVTLLNTRTACLSSANLPPDGSCTRIGRSDHGGCSARTRSNSTSPPAMAASGSSKTPVPRPSSRTTARID